MRLFNYADTMNIKQIPTQEVSQLEAHLCQALADPTRILILYALNERPRNVTELAHALGISQPTASRHLKILHDRDLVLKARHGTAIIYKLADQRLIRALDILRAVLKDRIAFTANLIAGLEA